MCTTLSLQPTCSPTCCQNRHPPPLPESVRHVSSPTHTVPLSSIHTLTLSAFNNYLQLWEGALQIPILPLTAHLLHHRTCPEMGWNFTFCIPLLIYTCCPCWLPKDGKETGGIIKLFNMIPLRNRIAAAMWKSGNGPTQDSSLRYFSMLTWCCMADQEFELSCWPIISKS